MSIRNAFKDHLKEFKEMGSMLTWVWQEFIGSEGKKVLFVMFWYMLVGYALSFARPWAISFIINGVMPNNKNQNDVLLGFGIFLALVLVSRILDLRGTLYREYLSGEMLRRLDLRSSELFFEKSLGQHVAENDLLSESSIRKGYDRVKQMQDMMLFMGLDIVLSIFVPYVALWIVDWHIALIATLMVVVHISWTLYLNQRVVKDCAPIDELWRDLARYRHERWYAIERVKVCHKEQSELRVIGDKFEKTITLDRKFWYWFIKNTTWRGYFTQIVLCSAMAYGAWQVWQGRMTVGILYPLFSWIWGLSENLWRLGQVEHQINQATPSVLSMKKALTIPCDVVIDDNPKTLKTGEPIRIEFQHVSYAYPKDKIAEINQICESLPVLNDISFVIEPGEKVALMGSSGVGKTTVMKLLLRFMDPTSGCILINGIDLRELDPASWLAAIGYVPQEAQILSGTLRYNLLYGLRDNTVVDEDHIQKMVQRLQVDFGTRLTQGLETLVGQGGVKLSGGQKQRVMVCAAAMRNPAVLIVDEATSSLDSSTEKLVQRGLEEVLSGDMSALIIAHRLSTVRNCEKFVLLTSNGHGSRVEAIANSFGELAQMSSEFRTLIADQGIVL